jgi:formate dehydrogenase maturation protein FdhE
MKNMLTRSDYLKLVVTDIPNDLVISGLSCKVKFTKTTVSGHRYLLSMKTRLICPACNSTEVKKIVYGYPIEGFDYDRFEVGGCCVTGQDPKYKCIKCESSW